MEKSHLPFSPLFQAGSQLDQRLQTVTTMQKHTHPISVPPILIWLDVQRKSRGLDPSRLLPNPNLTAVVELPEGEEEGEHLLAVAEKEIDPISEEKEVALGVVVEAHTEVAFHLGNLRTLNNVPCDFCCGDSFRADSQLALCFSFSCCQKDLSRPHPTPRSWQCHRVVLRVGESRARTRTEWNTQILTWLIPAKALVSWK